VPVIPATSEDKEDLHLRPGQYKKGEKSYLKNILKTKRTGGKAQVAEHLSIKHKVQTLILPENVVCTLNCNDSMKNT
jgi:hypothetical protein